ncbi:hypothetical protein DBP19_36950 [Streptomyces sp. CS090A]|uniref:hypothetical protein n=1 Tax=Streptomyces sp. CS090A TaxID=2162710 RepID=UPI000D508518|nr:hypothetical protein [Streptomyces sp. CS090A]PVC78847.1 hypothetical protein DBP19_36950 [Streptomyces sp. CS090A]
MLVLLVVVDVGGSVTDGGGRPRTVVAMTEETLRTSDGEKACAWCGGPIQQTGVGRRKDYCSRTHREYAYRARREAEMRLVAYSRGRADAARPNSTTVDRRGGLESTVDESRRAVPGPPSAPPRLPAPAAAEESAPAPAASARVVRPGTPSGRRPRLPPPPGVRREPTLFDE